MKTSTNYNDSFIVFLNVKIGQLHDSGCIRTWKRHNGFLNKLKKYMKGKDLNFNEIDYTFIVNFKAWLDQLPNERHPERRIHPNTVRGVLAVFRANINKAIREGLITGPNPFTLLNIRGVTTIKEKLTADEIDRINALDLPHGSQLWHCRNLFMFSIYCAGIRIGDLLQLRWRNVANGRLRYQMGKNHKLRDMLLVEQALDILKLYKSTTCKSTDYIFPFLKNTKSYARCITEMDYDSMNVADREELFKDISSKNILINKALLKITELAGIEKHVTMHISRHSFAKMAKDKGIDNSAIQQMLAHSSLKITELYMGSFDTSATDRALINIFTKTIPSMELWISRLDELLRTTDEDFVIVTCKKVMQHIVNKRVSKRPSVF